MRRLLPCALVYCLAAAAFPAAADELSGATGVVLVRKAALGARALPEAVRRQEYADFHWLELTAEQRRRLDAARIPYEPRPEATLVQLPAAVFHAPAASAAGGIGDAAPGLHVLQLGGPLRREWLHELFELPGPPLRLVTPLAPYNLLVWGTPAAVAAAAARPFVRWSSPVAPAWRLPRPLAEADSLDGALSVLLVQDGTEHESLRALEALCGAPGRLVPFRDGILRVLLPIPSASGSLPLRELLEVAAALPHVLAIGHRPARGSVRDEMAAQIVADGAPGGEPVPGYLDFLTAKGLDGSGLTVGVVDEGSDVVHGELAHDDALCLDYASSPATACTSSGLCGSHGTQTAGIVLGDGSAVAATHGGGFLKGLGIAPGARLLAQNFLCSPGQGASPPPGPLGWLHLSQDQVLHGAYVSANSWGPAGTPKGYDADTREFDRMPRDGDPATADVAEPVVFVLSIMNGGGGTSTQGTPDEGKNLIRVGASRNRIAGDIDDLCSCTAHGPALDGRMLPDLVAPGQSVYSAAPGDTHAIGTGTSFASPQVSGAAALVVQWFRSDPELGSTPSPALVKAILVGSAVDLHGGRDADGAPLGHRPDSKQGWGRLDLQRAVRPELSTLYFDQAPERTFTASGQSFSVTVRAQKPDEPMRISLVWTDAPGPGLGGSSAAWVNDLDLRVEGDRTYLGNVFADGWSAEGGSADPRNNVENVFVLAPGAGEWTVGVQATSLLGDGVYSGAPSTQAADFDQDFALVCHNCVLPGAGFEISASGSGLQAIAPRTGETLLETDVEVHALDGYSGLVHLSLPELPAGVSASFEPPDVQAPGTSRLRLSLSPDAALGLHTLRILGSDGSSSGGDLLGLRVNVEPDPTSTPAVSATATRTSTPAPSGSPSVTPTLTPAVSPSATPSGPSATPTVSPQAPPATPSPTSTRTATPSPSDPTATATAPPPSTVPSVRPASLHLLGLLLVVLLASRAARPRRRLPTESP